MGRPDKPSKDTENQQNFVLVDTEIRRSRIPIFRKARSAAPTDLCRATGKALRKADRGRAAVDWAPKAVHRGRMQVPAFEWKRRAGFTLARLLFAP